MRKRYCKKKRNRLFSGMAAALLFLMSFLLCAEKAFAVEFTIQGTGEVVQNASGSYSATAENLTAPSFEMDIVSVSTSGDPEIVYDVQIEWNSMQFEYDYGYYWEPSNHRYRTGMSGNQGGGWVTNNYVNGINNRITVTNSALSRFPMDVAFSFENGDFPMNADPSASGSVVGIFADYNPLLVNDALLKEGRNGPNTSNMTTATMTLETMYTGSGTYYKDEEGTFTKNMYFALSGIPDPGYPQEYKSVGRIIVNVSPAKNVYRRE